MRLCGEVAVKWRHFAPGLEMRQWEKVSLTRPADARKSNTTIFLADNKITDRRAAALAAALLENNCVCDLNLSGNALGSEPCAELADAISEWRPLVVPGWRLEQRFT